MKRVKTSKRIEWHGDKFNKMYAIYNLPKGYRLVRITTEEIAKGMWDISLEMEKVKKE